MPVPLEIDLVAGNRNTFGTKPQPLFEAILPGEPNAAACSDNPMPRSATARAKSPHHLPRRSGMSASRRNFAVGGYPPFGNAANRRQHLREHPAALPLSFQTESFPRCPPR